MVFKLPKTVLGFTLIEMSIVLIVISLILAGVLKTVSVQRQQLKRDETRQQLEIIRDALIGFSVTQDRLPCPDVDGDGIEDVAGGVAPPPPNGTACANDEGFIPFVDIGAGQFDAWGNRFRYRVTGTDGVGGAGINSFTDNVLAPAQSSFSMADLGNIRIEDAAGNLVANNIPAVIVSYGENGRQTIANIPCGAGVPTATEEENCDSANRVFIFDDYRTDYDDLVAWVPLTILKSRMIEAAKLP